EDEADDVVGAAVVEGLLQGRVDHVVGRRDHVAQGADAAQVVAVGAEGPDLGHAFVLSHGEGRRFGPGRQAILGRPSRRGTTGRRLFPCVWRHWRATWYGH